MVAIRHNPFPVDPTYAGIYSHAVEVRGASRSLLVSGQVGVAPDGTLPGDFEGQLEQAIANLKAVLSAASMTVRHITKLSIFLTHREDIPTAIEVRKQHFDGVQPAITTVLVAGLVEPDWRVELEAVAVDEDRTIERGRWV
ncbi:MAG: RidA family protein [Pseudomonadota bacterium]